jgi:hypothetical protein
LGLYRKEDTFKTVLVFSTYLGERDTFTANSQISGAGGLASLKRIHANPWKDDLAELIRWACVSDASGVEALSDLERLKPILMGSVVCTTQGNGTAVISGYYPREGIGKGPARGIPYFVETMITHDLIIRFKAQAIRNTNFSVGHRRNQLSRVQLGVGVDTPASEWLRGMGRGIKSSIL